MGGLKSKTAWFGLIARGTDHSMKTGAGIAMGEAATAK
jgi:hypothetical protein